MGDADSSNLQAQVAAMSAGSAAEGVELRGRIKSAEERAAAAEDRAAALVASTTAATKARDAAVVELQLLSLKVASLEELREEAQAQMEAARAAQTAAVADRAALQERANTAAETSIVAIERLQEHIATLEGSMGKTEVELSHRMVELVSQLAEAEAAKSAAVGRATLEEAATAEAEAKAEAATRVLVEFGAWTA